VTVTDFNEVALLIQVQSFLTVRSHLQFRTTLPNTYCTSYNGAIDISADPQAPIPINGPMVLQLDLNSLGQEPTW
jgi:hypothetical protein